MKDEKDRDAPSGTGATIKFWVTFVLLFGLLLLLNAHFQSEGVRENKGQFLYAIIWIFVVSSWFAYGGKLKEQFKHACIWAVIVLVMATGYSFRFELLEVKRRLLFNLLPDHGQNQNASSMSFAMAEDGHFYMRADVDGTPVKFLVDTGASHIVITPQVAKRLGYNLDSLLFDRFYHTANGTVRGSSIILADFTIGNLHLTNVPASINEAPMGSSLLGMSFFSRLESYQVSNEKLTIKWSSD